MSLQSSKLELSQGLTIVLSSDHSTFVREEAWREVSFFSSLKELSKALMVPSTVLVFPVPGGPWISVIPDFFKVAFMASTWLSLKRDLIFWFSFSEIEKYWNWAWFMFLGLRMNCFSFSSENSCKAENSLSKVTMLQNFWINQYFHYSESF